MVTPQKQTDVVISANFTNNTAGMCGGAGDVDGNGIVFIDTSARGNSDSAFCITDDLNLSGPQASSRTLVNSVGLYMFTQKARCRSQVILYLRAIMLTAEVPSMH